MSKLLRYLRLRKVWKVQKPLGFSWSNELLNKARLESRWSFTDCSETLGPSVVVEGLERIEWEGQTAQNRCIVRAAVWATVIVIIKLLLFESWFLFLSELRCNSLFRLSEMWPYGHVRLHIYVSLDSRFMLDDVRELDNPQWRTVCTVQFKLSESSRDVCLLELTQFRPKGIWIAMFGSAAPSRLQSTKPKYTELLFI
jgi:hypothetical protein